MRIIALRTLREFWQRHPDSEQPLRAWYANVRRAIWKSPTDVKISYRNASILPGDRAVFNIKGNDYRLVVMIDYTYDPNFAQKSRETKAWSRSLTTEVDRSWR